MAVDRAQTTRGALAGAVAAGVWAAQQPLDMKVFGVAYDDTELLGKSVTRGPAWRPVGIAMHLLNGALFGALYSAAAMAEHAATWPLTLGVASLHPAGRDFPPLFADPRALGQATWRHLVFGVVLGELERRLNAPADPDVPAYEHVASTNGHGDLEKALQGAS